MDQKIIDVLEELCCVVHDTRRSLLSKYRNLIQITGDDLSIIMDGILTDMTDSYRTLHASVKIAVISYSAAIARNARSALSDIATTATDLVTVASNSMAQYEAFKQSLDHISKSWNNTSCSMTNYMNEIDKKLLILNHLNSSLKSTRGPPSTDSRYSPDPIVGSSLILVTGSRYRSNMGILNFSADESIGFVGSNNEGQLLGELIKALGKPKPIEKVLNKDLNLLIIYLKKNPDFILNYTDANKELRVKMLNSISKSLPNQQNQWMKIDDTFM